MELTCTIIDEISEIESSISVLSALLSIEGLHKSWVRDIIDCNIKKLVEIDAPRSKRVLVEYIKLLSFC